MRYFENQNGRRVDRTNDKSCSVTLYLEKEIDDMCATNKLFFHVGSRYKYIKARVCSTFSVRAKCFLFIVQIRSEKPLNSPDLASQRALFYGNFKISHVVLKSDLNDIENYVCTLGYQWEIY